MIRCTCLDNLPLIPRSGRGQIRAKLDCPKHKTLAARWSKVNTWESLYEALLADDPSLPEFKVWQMDVSRGMDRAGL